MNTEIMSCSEVYRRNGDVAWRLSGCDDRLIGTCDDEQAGMFYATYSYGHTDERYVVRDQSCVGLLWYRPYRRMCLHTQLVDINCVSPPMGVKPIGDDETYWNSTRVGKYLTPMVFEGIIPIKDTPLSYGVSP